MNALAIAGLAAAALVWLVAWVRALREIRRVPEGAFAALGSSRSAWQGMVSRFGVFAVPLYYFRFRPRLLRAAEHATDLAPGPWPRGHRFQHELAGVSDGDRTLSLVNRSRRQTQH